jgi:very-short-patch-repair endonuclease
MRFARALVAGGLAEPEQQYRVQLGDRVYRIDLAYPHKRLAIEVDGWDVHRTRDAFDNDRARSNSLEVAGWHVVRFTSATTDKEAVATVSVGLAALGRKGG